MQITPIGPTGLKTITTHKKSNKILHNSISSKTTIGNIPAVYPKIYFLGNKAGSSDFKKNFDAAVEFDSNIEKPLFKKVNPNFSEKINNILNSDKNLVIGITGESASGKTTFCDALAQKLADNNIGVSIVSADNYFNDISSLINKYGSFDALSENGVEVDAPSNFQLDLLNQHIEQLRNGNDIKSPEYLINGTGVSVPDSIPVKAKKVIIVEGMATSYPPVREALDASIYVDINSDTRKERFLKRAKDRNQNDKQAQAHFDYTDKSANKFLRPTKTSSDIIIDGATSLEYFSKITDKILDAKVPTFKSEFEKLVSEGNNAERPFVEDIDANFLNKIQNKISTDPKSGIIIGVTGKSAAGKTTIAEKFLNSAKEKGIDITVVNSDQYFKDTSKLVEEKGSFANLISSGYEFDAPDNFRLEILAYQLKKLANGQAIKTPHYVGDGSGRCPLNINEKKPAKIILVEGLAAHYPHVRDVVDAKVFINIDEEERKNRFIARAPFRHPDWSMEQILNQYNSTTSAADKYIAPLKDDADVVLNSGASEEYIDSFIDKLTDSIAKLSKSAS